MPRQRIHHSRRTGDFPERLVRFQGDVENAVGRDSPAARRRPQDRQAAAQAPWNAGLLGDNWDEDPDEEW